MRNACTALYGRWICPDLTIPSPLQVPRRRQPRDAVCSYKTLAGNLPSQALASSHLHLSASPNTLTLLPTRQGPMMRRHPCGAPPARTTIHPTLQGATRVFADQACLPCQFSQKR